MPNKKKPMGRPRVHEVGKWSAVQFRMPITLRTTLYTLLEEKNKKLAYRLSLNSLLLELLDIGLNRCTAFNGIQERSSSDDAQRSNESDEEKSKKILQSAANSMRKL